MRPNSSSKRERRRSNLADIQVGGIIFDFNVHNYPPMNGRHYDGTDYDMTIVKVMVMITTMMMMMTTTQSDGSLSSSSETLLRVVEEGGKVELKHIFITIIIITFIITITR